MQGTVKFFHSDRGFGFIIPDEGGKDVFVHLIELKRCGIDGLREGQRVTFETEPDKRGRGMQAVNVKLG